jgi:hypothetical protein
LLGKYAHAGRTHPGFLHGTAVRLCAQPRYQGVTTSLQEMGKRPVPWQFIAVLSERDNHLNCGIVGTLMRGGGATTRA